MSCLHRKNGCFDRSHLVCGTARPQGWGTASLLGLISLFFPSANTESPSICVFWPWLSDCQNQENKIWQADGCTEKITTKCDKAVTHPVAWGPDDASATMAWNLCFSEAQSSASQTGCPCQWADVWNNLGQGEPTECFRNKRWGKSFSYLLLCNSQFPKISDIQEPCSRDYWFRMSY